MRVIGRYPLLYCGKDAVLYQCIACGSERTADTPIGPEPGIRNLQA